MTEPLVIGSRREFFWDDYLIDKSKTNAFLRFHKPVRREIAVSFDEAWENGDTIYHNILKDGDLYRMYYLAFRKIEGLIESYNPYPMVICYAESKDGLNWVKPELGICEFEGSKNNNIILDYNTTKFDNFFVFKDNNPNCPISEIYKGIGSAINSPGNNWWQENSGKIELWCFTSPDGIHFKKAWLMTDQGKFDTLNTGFWDSNINKYICYLRDFHNVPGTDLNNGIRDIRWMISEDFKNWSKPVLLDFGGSEDVPLYTNAILQYYRGTHMYIGFPTRYIERKEWTPNYDQLGGRENRRSVMKLHPRYGLAITDCVFMTSRDGMKWERRDEAFMTPGPEHEYNWVYGDCYPSVGMVQTASDTGNNQDELSMYVMENHIAKVPSVFRRFTMRIDGFASYSSTYKPCVLKTRQFIFNGKELSINFSTSVAGYIRIKLLCEGQELNSMEIFGDNLDRRIVFKEGDVSLFSGKPVIMEMIMSDADIYSFKFED